MAIINLSVNNSDNNENDVKQLQKETLQTVCEYLDNLIPGMETVAEELAGEEKDDTWEFLRMILDGFNWVVSAYNGTSELIGDAINAKEIDNAVKKLSDAYLAKNKAGVSESLKNDIIPFLKTLKEITAKY